MRLRKDRKQTRQEEAETRNAAWRALSPERRLFILYHERRGDCSRQIDRIIARFSTNERWTAQVLFEQSDGTPALGSLEANESKALARELPMSKRVS